MPRRPGNHIDDPVKVGQRVRDARIEAGLSQRALAADDSTSAYVSRVEVGARVPSLSILRSWATRLGVSAEYLATGTEEDAYRRMLDEATLATRLGELEQAAELYERVLAESSEPEDVALATMGQAEHAALRGEYRSVVELLEPLRDVELDSEQESWIAERLGRAYAHVGEYESSLAVIERAYASALERGDEPAALRFATLLANALLDSGNPGRAEELLAQALNIADRLGNPLGQAGVWWSQSRLRIRAGRTDIAARYARKAIDLLDASEHSGFAATAYQLLAHIENDRGNGATALEYLERGKGALAHSGNEYFRALYELERARALAALGEREEAVSIAMGVVGLFERVDPSDASRGYSLLADVFGTLGDQERALELYELAADRLPENDPYRADIYGALGELLEDAGRTGEAMAAYKQAAKLRASVPAR